MPLVIGFDAVPWYYAIAKSQLNRHFAWQLPDHLRVAPDPARGLDLLPESRLVSPDPDPHRRLNHEPLAACRFFARLVLPGVFDDELDSGDARVGDWIVTVADADQRVSESVGEAPGARCTWPEGFQDAQWRLRSVR